jgi:hypothetical protein
MGLSHFKGGQEKSNTTSLLSDGEGSHAYSLGNVYVRTVRG